MKRSIKYIVIAIIAVATLSFGSCAHQNKVGKNGKKAKQEQTVATEKSEKKEKKEKKSDEGSKQKKEKLQFISVDEIKGNFREGFKLSVTIENNTAFNLRVTSAEVHLSHDGHKIARVALSEEVTIPRNCQSQVVLPLRVSISTSFATISAVNNLRKGIFSDWTLDANATIATALGKYNFEENNIPLESILKHVDLSKFINKESLSKITATPVNSVKNFANKSVESVKSFTNKSVEGVKNFTDKSVESVKSFTDRNIESIKNFTEKNVESVKNFTDKNIEHIKNFVYNLYLKFK